jgi:hypothetical protein
MASTRTTPTLLGEHDGPLPERNRNGFWQKQMTETFRPNPGKTFVFGDVSPSTATNLRRDYGLDAYTHTGPDGVVKVYVMYDPERVDQIKSEVQERGNKRKATIAANKANGGKSSRASASK